MAMRIANRLRNAQEASSDEIANDWSGVAAAIGRRTRKRPPWLAHVFD
jgi:hypothetical protein